MKKITLLIICLTVSFTYAQTIPVDFETDINVGVNWNGDSGVVVDVVDDPGATMGKVGEVQAVIGGAAQPWQNAQLIMTTNYMDLTSATGSKIVSVDVYFDDGDGGADNVGKDFLFKLEDEKDNAAGDEFLEKVWSHQGNGWETLLVDFSSPNASQNTTNDGEWRKLIFFPCLATAGDYWANGACDIITYVDNIDASVGTSLILPPGDPLVLFEDFDSGGITIGDTAGPVEDFNKDALESLTLVDQPSDAPDNGIGGELVTAAASNPWQNAQLILSSNYVNLESGNKTIEVDVYTDVPLDYLLKVEDALNGGAATQAAAVHTGSGWETLEFDFTTPAQGGPVPDDQYEKLIFFPLFNKVANDFNGSPGNSAVTTSYVDNIYAAVGNSLGIDDYESNVFKAYPNPTKDNWTIKTANENITSIQVYDVLGKQVYATKPNSNEVIVSSDKLSNGLYFAKVKTINGESNLRLVKN